MWELSLPQTTPNKLLCVCVYVTWYADSKIYTGVQKSKNSENNLEK